MSERGLITSDSRTNCFIKNEASVSGTDPRNISPRTPEFLSTIGRFVAGLELAAHSADYLIKGLNMDARHAKLKWLKDFQYYFENDHSRFDKHVAASWILHFEVHLFMLVFPASDHPDFYEALGALARTYGVSVVGLLYLILGERLSGDAHTSIGNGNINFAMLMWCFTGWLWKRDWGASTEGDDGLIGGVGRKKEAHLRLVMMACLGFEVKLIPRETITGCMFCGRTMVELPNAVTSMCDISRTLSKFHITTSGLPGRRALLAKALSYLYTDGGTPIVGRLVRTIVDILKPTLRDVQHIVRSKYINLYEAEKIQLGFGALPETRVVDPVLRIAVAKTDNLTLDLQQSFEEAYTRWVDLGYIPARPSPIELVRGELTVDDHRHVYYGANYPQFYGSQ